ncbi:MAG: succinyl-diaminopimelate desuccinylase [Defluviicoccus sp.]|nr:succinyl-diaminopimelate desuccinylase [Defluviicoccus sp.]MDE0385583.1 succinyl-diaminopimelate desuccinylase [Defluviicoccus sp.]
MNTVVDAVELARALIRCPSVTPEDGGSQATLAGALERLGFACHHVTFSAPGTPDVQNLYARLGTGSPNFCFAGHTDVVPVGDRGSWTVDPFAAEIHDGVLYGRGAADMKGAIAAFVGAVSRFLERRGGGFDGSISLLITGDEEGPAINGTVKLLDWIAERGERIDDCLVGEPTNPMRLGEMIKIGRRGALSGWITLRGVQGHTAYPQLADNPLPRLARMLTALAETPIDDGTEHFQPSNLQLTNVDVGNAATNVIPGVARAAFNIRFNDLHDGDSMLAWVRERLDSVGGAYELETHLTGESFLTPPGRLSELIQHSIGSVVGGEAVLSTTGGTSDARFIKAFCAVAEFGAIGQTMHKVDERIALADLAALGDIYERVIDNYFPG